VNKRPKSELADVLQQRLNNADAQQELRTGLSEIFCIARDRLRGLEP
jgi:2-oxo-4-hydroxy-4-carboxy--5-ureidoimidazoline (OHCU) decarboxylase